MIFITHDLSTLADICRRIAVMYAGRIVEEGPERRGLRRRRAPVHARARRGVPGDRRPGVPHEPVRAAGRPAGPAPRAERLPVPPALPGARSTSAPRRPSSCGPPGPSREAACVHVRGRAGGRVTRRGPAPRGARPARGVPRPRGPGARGGRRGPRRERGRDGGPRGRVRLRQDDARPRRSWASSGRARARCASAASRSRYGRRALREHRRRAQMIFQDPTGALNARQTLYEAVAEGMRIQGLEGDEEQLVADALSRAGLRPPESFFTPLPVRDLRRAAPARDHRGRDGRWARACSWRTSPSRRWTHRSAARSSR